MNTWIALLRAVNVGGNNLISMSDLRGALESGDFQSVRSYLQSGNIVLKSSETEGDDLESRLEDLIQSRFALKIDFIVRSAQEWTDVIAQNPMPQEARSDPSHLLVHFLKRPATQDEMNRFAAACDGADETVCAGPKGIYIYYPTGVGKSKLKIPFRGTARNWNTVLKLAEWLHE